MKKTTGISPWKFHQCSILIFIYTLLLLEGRKGAARDLSKQQRFIWTWENIRYKSTSPFSPPESLKLKQKTRGRHLVNKANLVHNILNTFISFLYMFRATKCPSSGETTVSMRNLVEFYPAYQTVTYTQ